MSPALRTGAAALIVLSLTGCAYDYTQHTDRVAFSSGDAVKANLAQAAVNPYSPTARKVSGLGRNGVARSASATATPSP